MTPAAAQLITAADLDPRYSVDLTPRRFGGADVWAVIHGQDLRIGITAVTNVRCAAHALGLELEAT